MANNWTEKEDIIALFLYTFLPSGKWDKNNTTIKQYATLINRTPDAVVFKLGNLRSLDNSHESKGFSNTSNMDRRVWMKFLNKPYELILAYEESLHFFTKGMDQTAESSIFLPFRENDKQDYTEEDSYGWAVRRKRQKAFRFALLSSYKFQCCLSEITTPDMLIASHIVPWSKDEHNRTNPQNGLLLNALLDRAFDKGYFTLSPVKYETIISNRVTGPPLGKYLSQFERKKINLPDNPERWPKNEFLAYHNDVIFNTFEDSPLVSLQSQNRFLPS